MLKSFPVASNLTEDIGIHSKVSDIKEVTSVFTIFHVQSRMRSSFCQTFTVLTFSNFTISKHSRPKRTGLRIFFLICALSPLPRSSVWSRLYPHEVLLRFERKFQMSHEVPYFGRDRNMPYEKALKKQKPSNTEFLLELNFSEVLTKTK